MPRNDEVEDLPNLCDLSYCDGLRNGCFASYTNRCQCRPVAFDHTIGHVTCRFARFITTNAIELVLARFDFARLSLILDVGSQIVPSDQSRKGRVHHAQSVLSPVFNSVDRDASDVRRLLECVRSKCLDPVQACTFWHGADLAVIPLFMTRKPVMNSGYFDQAPSADFEAL